MASFMKLPGIEGGHGGCACCGYQYAHLPLDAIIGVGFGDAWLDKNGDCIYEEGSKGVDSMLTVSEAEELAKREPDNDWRIHLIAPLSERHYQRQGEGLWVLYEKGPGFA